MDVKTYLVAPVPRWLALTVIAGTAVAGPLVTYLTLKKKFDADLQEAVAAEVAGTEKFLSSLSTKPFDSPQEAAKALRIQDLQATIETAIMTKDIVEEQGYGEPAEDDLVAVAHNVFTDAVEIDFDFDTEVPLRTKDKPYIIEHDEFFESDWQSVQLTWFDGDEVLADEKDEHIPDIDRVVGEDNLQRFGYGSRDPNILYICNEKMETVFEVVRNNGKYTEQVLGFVQHEDRPGVRRFRTYDD